jgi:hypothetical protein
MSCQKIRSALNKKNILEPTGFSDAKRPVLFRPGQCVGLPLSDVTKCRIQLAVYAPGLRQPGRNVSDDP